MESFNVATSVQLEVKASAHQVWLRLHDFDNLHKVFSTVHAAQALGSPWEVGSKIKVTRSLPTKHFFLATYTIVRHDDKMMEFQFYSEDIVSPGVATVSTTWKVESSLLAEDNDECLVTISIAVVPQKIMVLAGRFIFAPFLKRIVKGTILQDLKDLAALFDKEQEQIKKPLLGPSKISSSIRPNTSSLASARAFKGPKTGGKLGSHSIYDCILG